MSPPWQHLSNCAKFWSLALRSPKAPEEYFLPDKIILKTDAYILRQVQEGKPGYKPILCGPPNAGHLSWIAVFKQDKSVVEKLMKLFPNHPIFWIEWLPATFARRNESIDDLLRQVDQCIEAIGGSAHLVGLCMAGLLFSMYAARFPDKAESLITMGAPLNTEGDKTSDMYQLVHSTPMWFFEYLVWLGCGTLWGGFSIFGFKTLNIQKANKMFVTRYFDLWKMVTNNDEEGIERDKDFWNWMDNPSRIAGNWYLDWVRRIFKQNLFYKGQMDLLGKITGFHDIKCRVVNFAGSDDDVTAVKDVFDSADAYSVEVMNVLIEGVGHIGLYISEKSLSQVDEGFIYAIEGCPRTSTGWRKVG